VDRGVDKEVAEHTFDRLTGGFLFHIMCGEVGFNSTLKVHGSVPGSVENDLTSGAIGGPVLGLLPASPEGRDR